MEFTDKEKRILIKALGERGFQIMQDAGIQGLQQQGDSYLSSLSPDELKSAMNGALIGIGMAMADAHFMFEKAGEIVQQIVARETPTETEHIPEPPMARSDIADRDVFDRVSNATYSTLAEAAAVTGKSERQIRDSCYAKGRFRWARRKMEVA